MESLRIDINQVTEGGLRIKGEITRDLWQLDDDPLVRSAGPLRVDAEATIVSGYLLLIGSFDADFELECVRCLRKFVHPVRLRSHVLQQPLENSAIADLTNLLREDILLALPDYPHCDAEPNAPQCPADEQIPATDAFVEMADEETVADTEPDLKPNVWDVLDKLKSDPES